MIIDNVLRNIPQYFTTLVMNKRTTSSTVQSVEAAINMPYLEKQSMITMVDLSSHTFGKAEMNLMETLPWTIGHWQRLEQTFGSLMVHLVLLANKTSVHIVLHVHPHLGPKVNALKQWQGPLLTRMSIPLGVVALFEHLLPQVAPARHVLSVAFGVDQLILKPIFLRLAFTGKL